MRFSIDRVTDVLFRRKIYDTLIEWKQRAASNRALLIEGARRVGKSTIAEEFGRNEYESYLLVDFAKASDAVKNAFSRYASDLDTLFMILSAEYGVVLHPGKSLVILDEVQLFPLARQTVKHLVADGRYHFLETGSLISIRDTADEILIPSEERKIRMHPMDFEEFCWALGEQPMVDYIRSCFEKKEPLEEGLHHKAMLLFRQFMVVGGMPQSISAYVEGGRDFLAADEQLRDILALYREDIGKAKGINKMRAKAIFDQIPAFLSRHEKRVRFSHLGSGSSYPDYDGEFTWLGDAMMVNLCYNTTDPNVGLAVNEDRTFVKCYMGDTGLLMSHAFTPEEITEGKLYRQFLNDALSVNEGMVFENAVAQCLVAAGYSLFFFTRYNAEKHRNDIEIDFIVTNKSKLNPKLFPIEVKSGKSYATKSLDRFGELYRKRIGEEYVIHTKGLARSENRLYLPAYMAFCL